MEYQPIEINEKAIYALKCEDDSIPTTEFIDFDQSLLEITGYENVLATLKNSTCTLEYKIKEASLFIESIQKDYPYLLKSRNFCGKNRIRSSYMSNPEVNESTIFSIKKNDLVDYHYIEFDSDMNHWHILESWIYDIFHGYFHEQTFERIRNSENIKLYSHRKYCYDSQKFVFNKYFSASINSNFGYGSASYLRVAIEYKTIILINYSDYIRYRSISSKMMIGYTQAFYPSSESWKYALDFVKETCVEYIENDLQNFVQSIKIECEKLVQTLTSYLKKDSFIFYKNPANPDMRENSKNFNFKDEELIKFRGEKISGALEFIQSLVTLNEIIPTHEYILDIEECGRKILTDMEKTMVNFYISHNEDEIKNDLSLSSFEKNIISYMKVITDYFINV